jgi:hypothetical protein
MHKQKKTDQIEVIGVKELYKKFELEKRRYSPSLFCIGTKVKKKRKEAVPLKLFKKIILEYLKLYFFDFYMSHTSSYFPLGGFLKKVTYPKWVRYMRKGTSEKQISGGDNAIGLFWYLRPSMKMYYMVQIKKLTGSSNRLPQIEKTYNNNFNKDLLPIFKPELKKAKENKTLYLCTLT